MNKSSTINLLIFASITILVVSACDSPASNKKLIYSEANDFYLGDDICKELGFDSILISKGDYPISFDKNENSEITLKILEKFGQGNGVNNVKSMTGWNRCREWIRDGQHHCQGWGFSRCCSLYPRKTKEINYNITLTRDNLLVIKVLEKVPYGEKGYELN